MNNSVQDMADQFQRHLDALEEPKPWWQSRAIIGSLITAAASLAALAGYALDVPATTELVLGLAGLVGSALAWWGRVRASRPISKTQVAPGLTLGGRQ
jgi:hypothetical protein